MQCKFRDALFDHLEQRMRAVHKRMRFACSEPRYVGSRMIKQKMEDQELITFNTEYGILICGAASQTCGLKNMNDMTKRNMYCGVGSD